MHLRDKASANALCKWSCHRTRFAGPGAPIGTSRLRPECSDQPCAANPDKSARSMLLHHRSVEQTRCRGRIARNGRHSGVTADEFQAGIGFALTFPKATGRWCFVHSGKADFQPEGNIIKPKGTVALFRLILPSGDRGPEFFFGFTTMMRQSGRARCSFNSSGAPQSPPPTVTMDYSVTAHCPASTAFVRRARPSCRHPAPRPEQTPARARLPPPESRYVRTRTPPGYGWWGRQERC